MASPASTCSGPMWRRLLIQLAIAAGALLLFAAVSVATGKVDENRGLGWDGEIYAAMVTKDLTAGAPIPQTRPLLILAARVPYAFGLDLISSFVLLNYLYAFALYLLVVRLLDRVGASTLVTVVIVANVALCIATSKMFAFYPVQIDLGAMALVTLAFSLAFADRPWAAAGACAVAAAAREFGIAAALFGMQRALRRRQWAQAVAYLPSFAVIAGIRWWVSSTNAIAPRGRGPLSPADAAHNLLLWMSPAFAVAFVYFALTVFGGISALLVLRGRWCVGRLRAEPELATFTGLVIAAAVAGNADIWRYLVFALPAVIVLAGRAFAELDRRASGRLLAVLTLVTIVTQRPFEPMDRVRYFVDWFPLYRYNELYPAIGDLMAIWMPRLGALALMMLTLAAMTWSLRTRRV